MIFFYKIMVKYWYTLLSAIKGYLLLLKHTIFVIEVRCPLKNPQQLRPLEVDPEMQLL